MYYSSLKERIFKGLFKKSLLEIYFYWNLFCYVNRHPKYWRKREKIEKKSLSSLTSLIFFLISLLCLDLSQFFVFVSLSFSLSLFVWRIPVMAAFPSFSKYAKVSHSLYFFFHLTFFNHTHMPTYPQQSFSWKDARRLLFGRCPRPKECWFVHIQLSQSLFSKTSSFSWQNLWSRRRFTARTFVWLCKTKQVWPQQTKTYSVVNWDESVCIDSPSKKFALPNGRRFSKTKAISIGLSLSDCRSFSSLHFFLTFSYSLFSSLLPSLPSFSISLNCISFRSCGLASTLTSLTHNILPSIQKYTPHPVGMQRERETKW